MTSPLPPTTPPPPSLPRVSIIGIGGVGGVLAASLHAAGKCALTLVARGASLNRLKSTGLDVTTFEGKRYRAYLDDEDDGGCSGGEGGDGANDFRRRRWRQWPPARVISVDDAAAQGRHGGAGVVDIDAQDYVLLTTKSYQLPSTLNALKSLSGPDTTIVPCTNGLPWWFHPGLKSTDPDGRLTSEINVKSVLGTVGMVSGNVVGDYDRWESRWPSDRNVLTIGEPFPSSSPSSSEDDDDDDDNNNNNNNNNFMSSRAQEFASLFDDTVVPVKVNVVHNIRSQIYDKLLINCSLNPTTAICNVDCGSAVEAHTSSARILRSLVDEAVAVASVLDDPPVELNLDADAIKNLYRGQYGLETSMHRDVQAGRQTEVDAIVRSVVELGQVHGVDAPRLRFAADVIEALEKSGGRG